MQGLCRCAQVCRTWRDITEDAKLWSKVGGDCRRGGWSCGSGRDQGCGWVESCCTSGVDYTSIIMEK